MVSTSITTALQGTAKERMEEPKTAVIKFGGGGKPTVEFMGFWSGKYIKSAMNALSKAYRTRHHVLAYEKKQEANEKIKGGENE